MKIPSDLVHIYSVLLYKICICHSHFWHIFVMDILFRGGIKIISVGIPRDPGEYRAWTIRIPRHTAVRMRAFYPYRPSA